MNKTAVNLTKLRVELKDLDYVTKNTLSFFFKSNLCSFAELNQIDTNADIVIIDHELKINTKIIADLERNNQYALVLHMPNNKPEGNDRVFNITKPIKAHVFKQQINKIHQIINMPLLNNVKDGNNNRKPSIDIDDHQVINLNKQALNQTSATTTSNSYIDNKNNAINSHLNIAVKKNTEKDLRNQYKSHKHVGSNKDIDPTDEDQIKKIYLKPEKYLYYHLFRAVKHANIKKCDVRIHTVFGSILFEYKTQLFHYTFKDTKLNHIQASPLFIQTNCTFIKIDSKYFHTKKYSQDIWSMIWNSAIRASRGRIPDQTNLNNVVEMKNWPNFTHMNIFRYAIQISAAWSTHKLSLIETANQLEIPQRYVFTLYNAMSALNYANISKTKLNDSKMKIGNISNSIFRKIISHIFKK